MIVPIPSQKQAFALHLKIKATAGARLAIRVYDPDRPKSFYHRREVRFGKQTIRKLMLRFPISPERMLVKITELNRRNGFSILSKELKELPLGTMTASPEQHRFMNFAISFAQKAGHNPTGIYFSPKGDFLIQYFSELQDELGNELLTPARTHKKVPRIQVSAKMFRNYSIPLRIAVLAHEGCHYLLDTRNEKEADLCGLKYYLDMGFPRIEALYAATKILGSQPELVGPTEVQRAETIRNFVREYLLSPDPEKCPTC